MSPETMSEPTEITVSLGDRTARVLPLADGTGWRVYYGGPQGDRETRGEAVRLAQASIALDVCNAEANLLLAKDWLINRKWRITE